MMMRETVKHIGFVTTTSVAALWTSINFLFVPLQGFVPFFVSATAGTTVYGAFDPLIAISDICKKYNVWMHVDVSKTQLPLVWNLKSANANLHKRLLSPRLKHCCYLNRPWYTMSIHSREFGEGVHRNAELTSEFDKSIMSVSPLTACGWPR